MLLQLCERVTVYGFGLDSEDGRMQVRRNPCSEWPVDRLDQSGRKPGNTQVPHRETPRLMVWPG